MHRVFTSGLAILLGAATGLTAQTPLQAAKEFFQAQTQQQWSTMASFVDAESLKALRASSEKYAASMSAIMRSGAGGATDSIGSPALARARESLQSMLGSTSMIQMMYARVKDADELRALSDQELMARWFEAKSIGYLAEMMGSSMLKGMTEGMPPRSSARVQRELDQARTARTSWDVVGATMESDSIAHVVYRVAGRTPPGATGVLTFHASNGRWLIRFTDPDDQLVRMQALAVRAMQPTR